jgi:glycosyltransferase involved in cell wall biosynthesis
VNVRISMVFAPAASEDDDRTAQVAELSAALARAGHDVLVHARRDDADAPDELRTDDGVTVVRVPAGPPQRLSMDDLPSHLNDFGAALAREWRQQRPDVVHAHFWPAGLVSLLATRGLDLPVVQTFHTVGHTALPREHQRLERLVAQRAGRIAATSSEEMFELLRIGVQRPQVSVVPYGVDLGRFAPSGPVAPRGERHRLLCVGRSLSRRDHEMAIAALPRVPNTELVITGGPEAAALAEDTDARRLRQLAERCGVADRVELAGRVSRDDLPALIRSADLVLCLARQAPLGTVPLEAMACAVPVIAAATGAVADMVVDGVTGRHVPPRDPAAIAEVARHLLTDPMVRQAFGAAGRDRVRARYSWERIAADMVEVYQRAGVGQRRTEPASAT